MKPLAILLLLTAAAGADDLLPQTFPKDRYAATITKSPFVLETKAEEPPVIETPFTQNLYLRGVGTADGQDYVLIQRLGEERTMRFIGNEPGPDGIIVKSVRRGNFRETKVVLERGGKTGEVGFKEDSINTPPPAANNAGRGPAMPGGAFPKPGTPLPSVMQNAVRPPQGAPPTQAIPRPGGSPPMPMPTFKQPASVPQPPGGNIKGRGRPINN